VKKHLSDLVIFGGDPAFPQELHVGRPGPFFEPQRNRFVARLDEALERQWLSNYGPLAAKFEAEVASITGTRHAIAVCNASTGLQIAARACGLGGEIILPAFTSIATAHAMEWIGLKPVFADVDPGTHNIDPQSVEQRITPDSCAILGVHLWGIPCNVDALEKIAARHRLQVLYDAAHAFGSSCRGRMIGGNGRAEVFSFDAAKFVHCGEGGAITTNDDALAHRMRRMSLFGYTDIDTVSDYGINGKMSEISAAMGLTSLEAMEYTRMLNRIKYELYEIGLAGRPGLRMLAREGREQWNYQYLVIEVDENEARITRDRLCEILWTEGVLARRSFSPGCHRATPYALRPEEEHVPLPGTDRLSSSVLVLPTGAAVTLEEVSQISELIHFILDHAAELSEDPVALATPAEDLAWTEEFLPVVQSESNYAAESRPG
jgi:dTDP-4-amino-4,6-dideoxygalactose transaminase